jgi:hypothetical protein
MALLEFTIPAMKELVGDRVERPTEGSTYLTRNKDDATGVPPSIHLRREHRAK